MRNHVLPRPRRYEIRTNTLKTIRKLATSPEAIKDLFAKTGVFRNPELNNDYIRAKPEPQHALDIFRGEWASKFPPPYAHLQAGEALLFQDSRLQWGLDQVGSLKGKSVLELGPLEGGHTYMLEQNGAERIVAVEANTRAYLKCLVTKEVLGLQRAQFLCGDFLPYLREPTCPNFDVVIASGVLYHMINPVELISLLADHCRGSLYLWTHYYDEAYVRKNHLTRKFPEVMDANTQGFQHRQHLQLYKHAVKRRGFCGGSAPYSHWLERDELLGCLTHFGFTDIQINFEHHDHPNGPNFSILAQKKIGEG